MLIFLFKNINIVYGDFVKRILVLLLLINLFLLVSCSAKEEFTPPDYPVVVYPDDAAKRTLDGYRKTESEKKQEEKTEEKVAAEIYYGNKNSKKFHIPECTYAKKMNESSIILEKQRDNLINQGYSPCSKCNP